MIKVEKDDTKLLELIKEGNVYHRRCDVCGCELAVPDAEIFSREFLTTMVCTECSYTKQHSDLLSYIEFLRREYNNDKAKVHKILDERMEGTWGRGHPFTMDDWNHYKEL